MCKPVCSFCWKKTEYLVSIVNTMRDKVNCSFSFKIGACHHGDWCFHFHNKLTHIQTILIENNKQIHKQCTEKLWFTKFCEWHVNTGALWWIIWWSHRWCGYKVVVHMNVSTTWEPNLLEHMCQTSPWRGCRECCEEFEYHWFNKQETHIQLSCVSNFRKACSLQFEMGDITKEAP